MAGYEDTRQKIISTLMGRPVGTEIQPENQQEYELNMLDYIRGLELIATSTLIGIAEQNTTPVQPNNSRVCYIAGVAQNQTAVFENFIDVNGNPISITTGDMEGVLVILMWNTQYWSAQTISTNIISQAQQAIFYYNYNIRKTYSSVAAMNADVANPIGTNGKYIKVGDLVSVVNSTTPSENGFYSYEGADNGWKLQSSFNFQLVQTTGTDINSAMSQNAVTLALNNALNQAGIDVGQVKNSIFINYVKLFEPTKINAYCSTNNTLVTNSDGSYQTVKIPVKPGEKIYLLQTASYSGFGHEGALWEKTDGTKTYLNGASGTKTLLIVPEDTAFLYKTIIFKDAVSGLPKGNWNDSYIVKTSYADITIDKIGGINPEQIKNNSKDLLTKATFEQAKVLRNYTCGGNLFDRYGLLENSGINRTTGTPFFNSTNVDDTGRAFSNKIIIAGGQQVTFSKLPFKIVNTISDVTPIYPLIAYFDSSDNFLGAIGMTDALTYTTLAGSAYFRVEVRYNTEDTGYFDLGIYAGSSAPSVVIPINNRTYFAPWLDWVRKLTDVVTFDMSTFGYLIGYWDTPKVGEIAKLTNNDDVAYKCSPKLPVNEGEQILLSGTGPSFGVSGFVDSNGTYISVFNVSVSSIGANQRVTVPTGAKYVVLNYEFGSSDAGKLNTFSIRRVSTADADADADAVRTSLLPSFIFNNRLDYLTYLSLVSIGELTFSRKNALTGYIRGEIQQIDPKLKSIVGSQRIKFVTTNFAGLTSLTVERVNAHNVFGINPIVGRFRATAAPSGGYAQKAIVKVTKSDLEALGLNFVDGITTGVDVSTGILKLASTDPNFSNKQVFIEVWYGGTEDAFLAQDSYWLGNNQVSYVWNDSQLYSGSTFKPINSVDWETNNPGKNFALIAKPYNFASVGSAGGTWYEKLELGVYGTMIPKNGGSPLPFVGIQITYLPTTEAAAANPDYYLLPTFFNKHMDGLLTEATLPINIPDDLIQYMTKEEMMSDGKIKPEFIPDFDTDNKKVVTIQNSDKIAMYGCSYTESYYALKKKSWINKLSNMLDIQLANFGVSGNRIVDINKRMRDNSNPYHSTIGIKEIKPTYIAIQNIGNETLNTSGNNLDFYLGEVEEAAELVKSYGAQLMLGTDWVIGNPSVDALLRDYADQNGYLYWGVGTISEKILANKYAGFWGGGHPATRTNATIWQEYLNFMRNLGVRQCIKVYRVRDEFKGGSPTIQDLNYDTIPQRMVKWNEINVGEIHLSETAPGWNYYDRLNETASGGSWAYQATRANNEYCNLIAKQNVAFNNWGLVEFILPVVKTDLVKAYIKSADTGLKFYVKQSADKAYQYGTERNYCMFKVEKSVYDNFATVTENTQYNSSNTGTDVLQYKGRLKGYDYPGYYLCFYNSTNSTNASGGAGTLTAVAGGNAIAYISASSGLGRHSYGFFDSCLKPLANFEEIASVYNAATGYYEIDITDYKYMQYDKLRVIVGKTGAFNISDVYCSAEGGIEKRIDKNIFKPLKRQGTELMTDTGMGATYNDQWELTDGAAFGTIPAAINQYPGFHSAYKSFIKLGYDAENFPGVMKKTFTIDEARGYRDVIVRVTARLFPKVYDTTKTPDDTYTNVQQITPSSYDLATLCVGLKMGTSTPSVERRMVDVGWAELEIRTCIPPYVTNMEVTLWRDDRDLENSDYKSVDWPLQVCDVSVQTIES